MHIFYKEARKMKYTSNHNFKLPAPSDTINVEVLNENFVNIDALIKTLESAKADKNSPSCAGTDTRHTDGIVRQSG